MDFAGRTLLIGGINPLGGGGGGVPWLVGLAVTKDADTFVTDSCCVFEVEGWVRLCVTVVMGFLIRAKTCLAVSYSTLDSEDRPLAKVLPLV